jgi:hypothetical protein
MGAHPERCPMPQAPESVLRKIRALPNRTHLQLGILLDE